MTAISIRSLTAAASAFALSLFLFAGTVSTPPAQTGIVYVGAMA